MQLYSQNKAVDINALIEELIQKCPDQVTQYREGKEKLLAFFIGQIMKVTKGQVDPEQVSEALKEKLSPEVK